MNTNLYQIDADVLARFQDVRADAVNYVMQPNEGGLTRRGEAARKACAEDINFHLDFLRPTLESGDITPFIAYLGWLVQVLGSRGIPPQSVVLSLEHLAAFFETTLGAAGIPIVAALCSGKDAVARGIEPRLDDCAPARWKEAEDYSAAALLGRRDDAMSLLEDAFVREDSLPLVAVHVIQPAMYDVGSLWQQNLVSVAQEHLATATSESWLAQSMGRAKAAPDNRKRALFACLAGNHHVLGLSMVADAFELDGWAVDNLGANSVTDALVARVQKVRPHLVGLSASLPQHLAGLREAASRLRHALGDACPRIAVGGLAINQFPGLAGWVGAEVLGADALTAVAAANQPLGCD